MEPWASRQKLVAEGDCGISSLLVPSPQSEAVTHEMEELSLQPTQNLPPLNERKNGENTLCSSDDDAAAATMVLQQRRE